MASLAREITNSHRTGPSKRVAIVGGGLGGLSAAIHLRLAGFPVDLFEANERVGGRANLLEFSGCKFDTGPSLLNYPWVFEDLFRAAGRNLYDYVSLIPVNPSVTFQWRDGAELSLSSDRDFLKQEFARFESGASERIDRFFADGAEKYRIAFERLACRNEDSLLRWMRALSLREARSTGVWRSVYGEVSRFFRSRHVREALASYSMYLGGSPFELPGLFSILPYGEMAHGLWLPRGGIYALVRAIEKLARELGVAIHTNTRVSRVETSLGRVTGLRLASGDFERTDVVVSNVDLSTTVSQLLGELPPKLTMTPGVVTFYWAVRGKHSSLGHHTIFLPDDYRGAFDQLLTAGKIPDDLPFYISIPSGTDPTLAPPGHSCIFALAPVPVLSKLGSVNWSEIAEDIRRRIFARLRLHGVSLEADIIDEQCYTPVDWRDRFGLFDGSAFGAAHTLSQIGPFRPSNCSPRYEGLFFTGSSTTPGAGMPMVVLSGRMTAERICAFVG